MSHLSQIAVILNSITGYTITQQPADHIPEGYYLRENPKQAVHDNQETEFFFLVIYGTSLSNLETPTAYIGEP